MHELELRDRIREAWTARDALGRGDVDEAPIAAAVDAALAGLDDGTLRVATPDADGGWVVHDWLRMAVLLSFRLAPSELMSGPAGTPAFDKVPLKFAGWDAERFARAAIRAVPGAIVRRSAHIGRDVVLMPSFVNVGARVGDGTMIDTGATVGSCAQVGARCHISGGTGLGGVLEPLGAQPVIVEDDCFVGARAEIAEGVRIGRGAVIAMGVFLGASTRIIDRATGVEHRGVVPPWSVVVPGALPGPNLPDGTPGPSLGCAVIVKTVDERTRARTAINELLRT